MAEICCSFKSIVGGQCSLNRKDRKGDTQVILLLMYQSNRSLNKPRAFDVRHAREGGNLLNLVFPGAGHLVCTHRGGEFDR